MKKLIDSLRAMLENQSCNFENTSKITSTVGLSVKGGGNYVVDLKKCTVKQTENLNQGTIISFADSKLVQEVFDAPEKAWSLAGEKKIVVTNRLPAMIFLEELFPGTLEKIFGRERFMATFPNLVKIDYPTSTEVFFKEFAPKILKENAHMLYSVSAAFEFHIEGAGIWTVDAVQNQPRIYEGTAKAKGHSIKTTRAIFEEILADDSKAWPYFNSGKIEVSNACRASQIVQTLWPVAFPKAMPSSLYQSLFPETLNSPSASEYNKTTGEYTTYVGGKNDEFIPIKYGRMGDLAIYEGDIILGTFEEMEKIREHVEGGDGGPIPEGFRIYNWGNPDLYIWPNGIVYYEVEGHPDAEPAKDVKDAMDHWVEKTNITFQKRTNQANYVSVREGDGCSASIGMKGGKQYITLSKGCSTGNIIHEIGHTIGLFHEQSRQDRDQYVTICWDQIEEGKEGNFKIPSTDISKDVGGYDYSSIMHYGKDAFAKGKDPTIVPKEDVEIGQRNGLSQDDIASVLSMYPAKSLVTV